MTLITIFEIFFSLHDVSFSLLFHYLCIFLLSLFYPAESILRCPESSMHVTEPIHLLAPLCQGSAQTFEDHTSGSNHPFSEATSFSRKEFYKLLHEEYSASET